jgi:hypothetical protein
LRAEGAMTKGVRSISVTIVAQSLAVALGWQFGFPHTQRWWADTLPRWMLWLLFPFLEPSVSGPISLALFFGEPIRLWAIYKKQSESLIACAICGFLSLYTGWLMLSEPFLRYDNESAIWGILISLPPLFAIGPLVRARAWFGVISCVMLFATCLSLIIHNACSNGALMGFFYREIR